MYDTGLCFTEKTTFKKLRTRIVLVLGGRIAFYFFFFFFSENNKVLKVSYCSIVQINSLCAITPFILFCIA